MSQYYRKTGGIKNYCPDHLFSGLRDYMNFSSGLCRKRLSMQQIIQISTPAHNGLYDITRQVEAIVAESGVLTGLVNDNVQGPTDGVMVLFI